jgi:hypothetical protein
MHDAPSLTLVVVESAPGPVGSELFEALENDLREGLLEVVLVCVAEPPQATTELPGVRAISAPKHSTVPERRGLGLAASRTPLVALTESFCVPSSGWARAMIEAHSSQDVVAVGGPVDRLSSGASHWAMTLAEYGRFLRTGPEGPVRDLPGVNVAFRIDRLRRALGQLPARVVEVELHQALVAAGETLWCVPPAVVYDRSRLTLGRAVRSQVRHGRLFAGRRVRGRPWGTRLMRLGVAPAVPLLLFGRIARRALAAGKGRVLFRAGLPLFLLLIAWATGEAVGSVLGEGDSERVWV